MKNNKISYSILGHLRDILIVIILGNVISFLFRPDFMDFWNRVWWNSIYSAFIGTTLWKGNQFIGYYLSCRIDHKKNPHKALWLNLTVMFFYTIFAIFVVNYIWYVLIFDHPLQSMFKQGYIAMIIEFVVTVVITTIYFAAGFFQAWRETAVNEERLKKESIALQYRALRNQVNPHFLFNSLNTLSTLVYKNQDQAVKFIKELSEVYRYVLEQRETELVDVDKEIKFLEDYLFLQKIRHGDSLEYKIELEKTDHFMIVPMALQILVENAIKHNVVSRDEPLKIEIFQKDGYIEVKNNLQKKTAVDKTGGIGLGNLQSTYSHLTDKKIVVEENEKEFIVKIPLLKPEQT
ncbi:MAG: histidine kinase [Bacteroidales bacterium]|nr:histidine kinase [Bacteroidales bacterium]